MRIHFYDHSGAQISPPLNFHRDFQAVVGIIHMFAHANRVLLGFNPTIDINHGVPSIPKQPGPIFNFIGTVQGVGSQIYCIFELLWASTRFIGHGTVCYHIRPEVTRPSKVSEGLLDDYNYVLKDNWVNQAQVDHEPNILKHIAGIEGVPVLVDSWAVQFEEKEDIMLHYRPVSRTKHVWYSEHGTYYRFEFILEQAMSVTHVAVILCTRTGPAYEEESMKTDYPDARNEYGMS